MDVSGKVVIITGGGTGLGAAVARKLAPKGARLALVYSKSRAETEAVAEDCRALGGESLAIQGDVGEDADCRRAAKGALDQWGRIDVLVNNAAITTFVDFADLDGLSADDFLGLYRVNVIGPYQMTRAVVPAMRAVGEGRVVNISSVSATLGVGSSIAYCASKGGLNALGTALARTLAPEIMVNTVCPGLIKTGWHGTPEEVEAFAEKVEARVPLHHAGEPEEVAEAVLWFIEAPHLVTGESVLIDGGLHLIR